MADERIVCPACGKEEQTREGVCAQCGFLLDGVKEKFRGLVKLEARKGAQLFLGDAFLGIATSEEAEVLIDGQLVGNTQNRYLAVKNLSAGRHLVEARTPYSYGRAEVELGPKDAKRVDVDLEAITGDLRILSDLGDIEVEVGGKRYRPPVFLSGIRAGRYTVAVHRGEQVELMNVDVPPGELAELELTEELFSKSVITLVGHADDVNFVAFSPDGSMIASGSWDKTIKLWQASDGALLGTLLGHSGGVTSVAFSPDGSMIASGSEDKTIKLWRASDGALLRTLEDHTDWVTSVAFSPDGSMVASGSADKTINLWRVADGELLDTLGGDAGSVRSVAFSPDGSMIASGNGYRTVNLWRVSDGELLGAFKEHARGVESVAFSPGGNMIASGSDDNTVKLWPLRLQ